MRVDPTQLAAKAGEIILTLSKEGDRGCVLVAAVLLEQAIESSIRARLIPAAEKEDELISRAASVPISSFSSKINLSYRLGLISRKERVVYHQLRSLRNACAHNVHDQDFSQLTFKNRIKNMIANSETMWHTMLTLFGPMVDEKVPPGTVDEFVEKVGWRQSFTLFFSLLVAQIELTIPHIHAIEARYH